MKPFRFGIVLGLAGNLLLGWGIYNLGCGGDLPACAESPDAEMLATPIGLAVSVVGLFAGGGVITFLGIFTAIGVGGILHGLVHGDSAALIIGGVFLLPLVLALVLRRSSRRAGQRAERLRAEGRKGIATVVRVEDTGSTLNENPGVRLTLRIEPEDGSAPFERATTTFVSRVAIPRAGDRYPVWYDPQDPARLELGVALEPAPATPAAATPDAAPPAGDGWVGELAHLNQLRLAGALSEEEFARAKARLLGESPPAPAGG